MKPRSLALLGVGMGLAAGGATAVVIGAPGSVSATPAAVAVSDDGTGTTTTDSAAPTDGATPSDPSADASTAPGRNRPDPGEHITEALQPLIDDGTLTQEQADKVITALQNAGPFGGGQGGPGGMHGGRAGFGLDAAATALGVSVDDLRSALADGQSIADVAATQGVEVQTVIDALVAEASTRIDQQVTDGKLTADEAATKKAELTERITEAVNQAGGNGPGRGPGGPEGGPGGERPSGTEAAPDTGSSSPDTTTGS